MSSLILPLSVIGMIGSTIAYYGFEYQYVLNDKQPKYKAARDVSNGIFWTSVWGYLLLTDRVPKTN